MSPAGSGAERADPARAATIAVTGASGWIGGRVCATARERGLNVRALARADLRSPSLPALLAGSDAVIHAAGLAHARADAGAHDRANVDLSVAVARAAREAGVPRLVAVSTAKVMGSASSRPFVETDPPAPGDAYARSKLRAERELLALDERGRFEVTIARPPLVWGPGARANFRSLLRLARGGLPLPLADAVAPRSMVHVDNLVDALLFLASAPGAGGRVFFVSDGRDASAAELVRALRECWGMPPRLFAAPRGLWTLAGRLGVARGARERLFAALQVDASALCALGWRAPLAWSDAIAATARAYAPGAGGRPA